MLHREARTPQAAGERATSCDTFDCREAVAKLAADRPGLRSFGNCRPRVVAVCQSRIATALEALGRAWSRAGAAMYPASTVRHRRPLTWETVSLASGAAARGRVRENE